MKTIKVTKGVLSDKERAKIRKSKYTIDLAGPTFKERVKARKSIRIKKLTDSLWLEVKVLVGLIILALLIIYTTKVYGEIPIEPVQAYSVDEELDKNIAVSTDEFLERADKIYKEKREFDIDKLAVIHKKDSEVIQEAMKFLKKYEGMRTLAYFDHKQWSVCYGTKSYKGEIVSKENCDKRLEARVKTELLRINRLADNLAWNKKVALISFMYNTGYNYKILNYARRGDDKSVIFLVSQYNSAGGVYLKGLQKRRNAEIDYYMNK